MFDKVMIGILAITALTQFAIPVVYFFKEAKSPNKWINFVILTLVIGCWSFANTLYKLHGAFAPLWVMALISCGAVVFVWGVSSFLSKPEPTQYRDIYYDN